MASHFLSSETTRALSSIRSILEGTSTHGIVDIFSLHPLLDILLSLHALSRLQRALPPAPTKRPPASPIPFEFARYAAFANAAYGWQGQLALGEPCRGNKEALLRLVQEEDVVEVQWKAGTHRPAYFLARDFEGGNLVLCVRGTFSPRDVLTDLCCDVEAFGPEEGHNPLPARAHRGMLEAAKEISARCRKTVARELANHPGLGLVLVGHSLGGGTAAVLGTLWQNTFNLKVYSYGSPCVAPAVVESFSNVVSIVGEGDPFSCLSLGHVADVSCALSSLCQNAHLRNQIFAKTKGKYMSHRDLQWCRDTLADIGNRARGEKLYPPGRVFFVQGGSFGDKSSPCTLTEVPLDQFRDLRLHPRMFDLTQHGPGRYERALGRLWTESRDSKNYPAPHNKIAHDGALRRLWNKSQDSKNYPCA